VNRIVDKLLEDGLVEITQQEDHMNQQTVLRAHVYIAPNEQVKLIRTLL
jgi:predicted transcriptional regulator